VTTRLYDLVEAYRDLGGNLLFLSANNFFRRVVRDEQTIDLVDEWRNLGRPESALLGVQYVASDRGERRAPFTVVGADAAPWAFAGTGLANGSTFGLYGIEIDARSPASPPSTEVLARIPDLFGPGRSAEMTYYEHWSGARVFSAGALDFGGQVLLWPETRTLLENVWRRLAP
jgi:N,N-dimethylformamidase beta subunit-like, C-terminal